MLFGGFANVVIVLVPDNLKIEQQVDQFEFGPDDECKFADLKRDDYLTHEAWAHAVYEDMTRAHLEVIARRFHARHIAEDSDSSFWEWSMSYDSMIVIINNEIFSATVSLDQEILFQGFTLESRTFTFK